MLHTEKGKAYLEKLFRKAKEYIPQTGEGLGERMYQAIEYVLEKGYDSCVLIGTDIPELKCSDLEYAFRLLDVNDVVFGPTVDEGYYLVGMKDRYVKCLKEDIWNRKCTGADRAAITGNGTDNRICKKIAGYG